MVATFVGQIIAVAVAFGVNLSPDQQKAILALAATIGAVLLWADVQIRKNRAQNADKIAAAVDASKPINVTVAPTVAPPAPTDTAPAPKTKRIRPKP